MNAGWTFVAIGLCVSLPIACAIGVGMYFCWRAIQNTKKKSTALREAPLVDIKNLASGLHKIEGVIRGHEKPLRSPLSRKKCVYYRFHVQELQSSGHGRDRTSSWVTVVDDKDWTDLNIEDETGAVEIDLAKAEVTLTTKAFSSSGTFANASPELEELMQIRYGKSTKGWIFNKSMRYTESYLRDGDTILVVGDVKRRKGEAPEFTKGENPLLVTDMEESQLGTIYTGHTVLYWFLLCFLGFLLLATCGMGGLFTLIGIGVGGIVNHMPDLKHADRKPDDQNKAVKPVAKPRPINLAWDDKAMASTFLSDLPEENVKLGWGRFGKNGMLGYGTGFGQDDTPIKARNKKAPKGLSFHPPDAGESSVQYRLNGQFRLFKALITVQDMPKGVRGSLHPLIYKVFGDGDLLWISDPIQEMKDVQNIRISVEHVQTLELRVHCAGQKEHAWAVWIDPHLLK